TRRSADGSTNTLTAEDAEVAATIDNVVAAVPEVETRATVRAGNTDAQTSITGTTADYVTAKSWPLERGVFLNDDDNRRYAAGAGRVPQRRRQPPLRRRGGDRPHRCRQPVPRPGPAGPVSADPQRALSDHRRDAGKGRDALGSGPGRCRHSPTKHRQ